MTTPRQPRLESSSTAQIRLRALVSPGKRPMTLVLEMLPLLALYELSIQLARLFAPAEASESVAGQLVT